VASNSTLRFLASSTSSGKDSASESIVSIALTEISFLAMNRLFSDNATPPGYLTGQRDFRTSLAETYFRPRARKAQ
jgi:hypothetical protein